MNLYGHLWSKSAPSFHEKRVNGNAILGACVPDVEHRCLVILQTGHLLEIPGSVWSWQAPPYHDRWRQREREREKLYTLPTCDMVM